MHPPVALFGEALIDEFASQRVVGGAPFNVACALAQFDCAPLLISAIGNDPCGELVKAALLRFGLVKNGVQVSPSLPTGRVIIEQSGVAHRFTILPDQAYDAIETPAALAALRNAPPQMLYFGTLAQRSATSWQTLQQVLRACTAQRFLDVNLRDGQVERTIVLRAVEHADILKVNCEELEILATWAFGSGVDVSQDLDALIARMMQAFSLSELIVTNGAHGWRHISRDGSVLTGAAAPVAQVVDTVGAGDAFSAIYLVGHLHRWPLPLTLQRAAEFSAAVCQLRGAVATDLRFYAAWYANWFAADEDSGAALPDRSSLSGATP
ncbi:MAG: PfkB family carbohydrate kinase [Pseudomonadota bacterium]|nr:PfkB family carbohydrate kinase [Pseudomonadota bacterium]